VIEASLETVGLFIPSPWYFVLLSLMVYRLARLIAIDDGPADILLRSRSELGGYDYGPNGQPQTSLGRGITCTYCVGFWIALFVAIAAYPWPEFIVYWLALAGAQSFLQSLSRNLS